MMKWVLRQIFERVARGAERHPPRRVRRSHQLASVTRASRRSQSSSASKRPSAARYCLAMSDSSRPISTAILTSYGDRAVGQLMRMAFSGAYRYRANPLLLAKRNYLQWRNSNQDFARAKANARHHYGLPFEFFRLMLGDDCLYAEGYWPEGTMTLAEAQRQRCDYICRKLMLRPGDRLVEVGSGWGGMAMLAAEKYGADVVNYGLVPEQNRIMQARLEQRGLTGSGPHRRAGSSRTDAGAGNV